MDIQSNLSILIPNHNEEKIKETEKWCRFYFPKAEVIIQNDLFGNGKGYTLRNAFKKSTKKIIVLIDGDMDIHPLKIFKLLPYIEHYDAVIGTKHYENCSRKKISSFAKRIIKLLFRLPLSDTQTGLKLFRREALPEWKTNGFLFDVEILYKAYRKGFRIKEVPVKNILVSKQKSFFTLMRCLCELLWLRISLL